MSSLRGSSPHRHIVLVSCALIAVLRATEPEPGVHPGPVRDVDDNHEYETFAVAGSARRFANRVIFNTALPWVRAAHEAALPALREIPGISVVVPTIDLPADRPVIYVGTAVRARITSSIIKSLGEHPPKDLVVCTGVGEASTIVVGSVHAPQHAPASAEQLAALIANVSSPYRNRTLLAEQPLLPKIAVGREPFPVLPDGPVVEYDFTRGLDDGLGHGRPFVLAGLAERGADGLLLWWQGQPWKHHDDNRPDLPDAYQAVAAVPGIRHQALTVTLTWCPAELSLRRDLLFCLGERWRWCAAHVDAQGRIAVGFNNQDTVFQPAFAASNAETVVAADVVPRRWQTVSVGYDLDLREVRVWVDGVLRRKHALRPDFRLNVLESPDVRRDTTLGFVHPAGARRMQGMVARLRIDNGLLETKTVLALHQVQKTSERPLPSQAIFTGPIPDRNPPAKKKPVAKPQPPPAQPAAAKPPTAQPPLPPPPIEKPTLDDF